LPEDYVAVNDNDGKEEKTQDVAAQEEPAEHQEYEVEDGMDLESVPGFSNWRKVARTGEKPYYFHIVSQQTSWEMPTEN
jgi:hypothetical protein